MTTDKAPSVGEFVAFLDGTQPLDGVWFGSSHPSGLGPYWWRKYLPLLAASPSPGAVLRGDDGSRPLPFDRDTLGRMVREAWVRWAQTQVDPKPSWLVPYDRLNEADKEADRCIGEAVARWTLIGDAAANALASQAARMGELQNRISEAEQVLQSAGPWVEIVGDALKALRGET